MMDSFKPLSIIDGKQGNALFIGNDQVRNLLATGTMSENLIPALSKETNDLMKNLGLSEIKVPNANFSLIVSVNDRHEEKVENFHVVTELCGIKRIYLPINENTLDTSQRSLFNHVLEYLLPQITEGLKTGDVLVHCNQGEHRSAAIVVLWVAENKKCSFREAWKIVHSKRSIIKPCDVVNKRQTLMTHFCRYHEQIDRSKKSCSSCTFLNPLNATVCSLCDKEM